MKTSSTKVSKYQCGNVVLKSNDELGALVLGDCNSAMDKKIHKQFKIQTVISIGQQAMPIKQKLPENCKHFFYDIHDNKSQKVPAQLFDEINNLIEEGRKNGGVLVHCYAGVSRSSSFVIAYIMHKSLKSYDAAKQQVKNARSCIHPNDGFVHQLKHYQKVLEHRQNQRLKRIQQEKNRLIAQSLIRTTRKSIRGGVKGAAISTQKVKQINKLRQKKSHQLFIQPIQQQIIPKKQKDQDNNNLKNNNLLIDKVDNDSIKEKLRVRQKLMKKSFSIVEKKKQNVKLPKVNVSAFTQRVSMEIDNQPKIKRIKNESVKNQILMERKAESNPLFMRKQKLYRLDIQHETKVSSRTQSRYSSSMRDSKSIASQNRQKSHMSELNESLLNEHEKKIKKIYESKVIVR